MPKYHESPDGLTRECDAEQNCPFQTTHYNGVADFAKAGGGDLVRGKPMGDSWRVLYVTPIKQGMFAVTGGERTRVYDSSGSVIPWRDRAELDLSEVFKLKRRKSGKSTPERLENKSI